MAILFSRDELQITDDWIRTPWAVYAIADVTAVWTTRRQVGRGSRLLTAVLGFAVVLVLIGGAGLSGWLVRNWVWVLVSPILFLVAGTLGLLDPLAIYLEKRHHELWITTGTVSVRLWKANQVEVRKALRQIQRASERYREDFEV
jgi:hypothetical protein